MDVDEEVAESPAEAEPTSALLPRRAERHGNIMEVVVPTRAEAREIERAVEPASKGEEVSTGSPEQEGTDGFDFDGCSGVVRNASDWAW